ncbi:MULTISPECIES: HlyD family type I secretion periplasmic adaptor subunit [unclassified Sphingomonas]|uniref:HlyD family type I secretion periplasmic adaptor subunit n=1 Tax=unclassified Sphingomonas TaxID=196159 RepID=UPI000A9E4A15|nr:MULTISPECIES: HlyD family type I secretion periplasmic adaptor subunit [unclassified Sphingomonas]
MNMQSTALVVVPQPLHKTPARSSNLLLWVIVGMIVVLVGWAALTQIDRTVNASARVVPTAQLQRVSNLEGGIVAAILVKAGDTVATGTPLVQLDQTETGAALGSNSSTVNALSVKVARLEAEIAGRTPVFPNAEDAATREQIGIERSLYISRQADYASLTSAARARIAQAERAVAEAEGRLSALRVSRNSAIEQADLLRPLVEAGVEPRLSLMQAERTANVASEEAAAAQATVSRARASVTEARAALAQAQQEWRSQAAGELAAAQAELITRRRTLPALRDKVQRTLVRSPLQGKVNRVLVNTVGGTIRPGEPLVEIVPSESGLTVEAAVRPQDIAFIRPGQRALVKLTAYNFSTYGGLDGVVEGISPDAIVNERTGDTHYLVRVRTKEAGIRDAAGNMLPITPGMIADVALIGDKRSVLSYFLTPFTRLSESAFRE